MILRKYKRTGEKEMIFLDRMIIKSLFKSDL